jgi:signal transduction histidine kinase
MRRLYLQIYLGFVLILALSALLGATAWLMLRDAPDEPQRWAGFARLAARLLPPAGTPAQAAQRALDELAAPLPGRFTLRAADGALIAARGEPLAMPPPGVDDSGVYRVPRLGPAFALRLPDGRWLLAHGLRDRPAVRGLLWLAFAAALLALGAYPLSRRITRRLMRLQQGVERFGRGETAVRVPVEGRDEIAALAASFNDAAARIEQLMRAQRDTLAAASHELRSPLARLRMGFELADFAARPELRAQLAGDIAELDELIDELLTASRLDAAPRAAPGESVDLLALLAEEAARVGAGCSGSAATLSGDARLLRRMLRNLLENARRHAPDATIEARIDRTAGGSLRVVVEDDGPGIPEAERERIFEPFYRPPGSSETGSGAGLGLALVRRIARHHGGEVRCLPRAGGGVRFEVDLGGYGGSAPEPRGLR